MQDELAGYNFQVIAVAIDENVEAVRAFMDGIGYPVLMDSDHVLTELYSTQSQLDYVVLSGSWLSWIDFGSGTQDVFVMFIPDRGVRNVTRRPAARLQYSLDAGRIAWSEIEFSNNDVWLYEP